eukprot:9460365-Prorocentrum_lima.AAC.1
MTSSLVGSEMCIRDSIMNSSGAGGKHYRLMHMVEPGDGQECTGIVITQSAPGEVEADQESPGFHPWQ